MLINIERLTQEEIDELKTKFGDRFRTIYSIHGEVCRLELDVHIDNFNYEHQIEMSNKSKENLIDILVEDMEDNEEIFQALSDIASEKVEEHFKGLE